MTKQNEKQIKEAPLPSESLEGQADEIDSSKVEEVQESGELEQLKQKLEETDNSFRRALADYQNLQKRVTDERRALIVSANKDLLLRILSVLDTLELANKHDESEGLKVSIRQFLDVLKSEGVDKIETLGKEFDPVTMEVITVEPGEDGKVLEEIRTGYILNDKLLRPAQVKVGKE